MQQLDRDDWPVEWLSKCGHVDIAVGPSFVTDHCWQVAEAQNTKHKNRSSWTGTKDSIEGSANKPANNEMLDKPINDTTESHNVTQV